MVASSFKKWNRKATIYQSYKKIYCIAKPNKSVKGTRRPLAVLKFCFLSRFGGFAKAHQAARPLP